jgi:hypothetical protein
MSCDSIPHWLKIGGSYSYCPHQFSWHPHSLVVILAQLFTVYEMVAQVFRPKYAVVLTP